MQNVLKVRFLPTNTIKPSFLTSCKCTDWVHQLAANFVFCLVLGRVHPPQNSSPPLLKTKLMRVFRSSQKEKLPDAKPKQWAERRKIDARESCCTSAVALVNAWTCFWRYDKQHMLLFSLEGLLWLLPDKEFDPTASEETSTDRTEWWSVVFCAILFMWQSQQLSVLV